MEALPVELFATRPVLSVGYAGALMSTGEVAGVEARLRDAERGLGPSRAPSVDMVVVDREGFRRLPSGIAMYRAGQALIQGDLAASMTHARRALDLADACRGSGRDARTGRRRPAMVVRARRWGTDGPRLLWAAHTHRALGRWAAGEPVFQGARAKERAGAPGVDESLEADLLFPSGATGSVHCSMAHPRFEMTLRVDGTRGGADVHDFVQPHKDDRVTVRTGSEVTTEHHGTRSSYIY